LVLRLTLRFAADVAEKTQTNIFILSTMNQEENNNCSNDKLDNISKPLCYA
jgi:hypothetical protein